MGGVGRVLLAVAVVAVVAGVALVLRRRQRLDAPTQARHSAPVQLDRRDFPRPEAPWLLAVFSSASCHTCADVVRKAQVAACDDVEVVEVEYGAARALHDRYAIDAVPTLVLADGEGVVRVTFLGPVTATDLWAAVAEARAPGSSPEPELGRPGP